MESNDLREINEDMENMGTLQPGFPAPTMTSPVMDININRLKGLSCQNLENFAMFMFQLIPFLIVHMYRHTRVSYIEHCFYIFIFRKFNGFVRVGRA